MPSIELTEREAVVLQEVLESYLSDLRMEIADTDRMSFREKLKERKMILLDVLEALKATRAG
ncbi:MAG: hypothetical protein ACE5JR_03895 [Gemmatimonadota bacterium]